jgi:hypothetical protein
MSGLPNDGVFHSVAESSFCSVFGLMSYSGPGSPDQPSVQTYAIGLKRGLQIGFTWSKKNSAAIDDYQTIVQLKVIPKGIQLRAKYQFASNVIVSANSAYAQDGFSHTVLFATDPNNPSINTGFSLKYPAYRCMYSSLGAAGAALDQWPTQGDGVIEAGGVFLIESRFYVIGTTANISTDAEAGWMVSLEADLDLQRQPKIE